MQRTRVLRVGRSLRERLATAPVLAGRLHSVFARALNIEWHDGGLVTLQGPGPLAAPFAVALAAHPSPTGLRAGVPVRRESGGLRLGVTLMPWDEMETVDLRVGPARRHTCEPDPACDIARAAFEASRDGCGSALASEAGRRGQRALARGIRSADAGAFLAGALALIGLGEGLTPAGDDCLVGALAVLLRFGRAGPALWARAGEDIARAAERGTTEVSRAFIDHALGGEFSEPILDLLRAGSAGQARVAAERLRATGATSGADTLAGMVLAFEALEILAA